MRLSLLTLLLMAMASTFVGCRDAGAVVQGHPAIKKTDRYARTGFSCYQTADGLWVFRTGSQTHGEFCDGGPDDKAYKAIGEGPGGLNLISFDKDTVVEFLGTRSGFVARWRDEACWVWPAGSGLEADILAGKLDEKCFTGIGEGPLGTNLKADSTETALVWAVAKAGFRAHVIGKEIWIARAGSEADAALAKGETTEKGSTLIGEGPGGRNLCAYDAETLTAWEIADDDFATYLGEHNRIWAFVPGSEGHMEFLKKGPPEVHAALIGEGPGGRTICADEMDVAKAYLASIR